MAVADKNGKLVHVTHSLATALGSTSLAMKTESNKKGWEAIMPQPFSTLHKTLAAVSPQPNSVLVLHTLYGVHLGQPVSLI